MIKKEDSLISSENESTFIKMVIVYDCATDIQYVVENKEISKEVAKKLTKDCKSPFSS